MSNNIKYEKGMVNAAAAKIGQEIQHGLADRAVEYDQISSAFANSRGKAADSLREQLTAEKEAVIAMSAFYQKLIEMIRKASCDLDQAEEHYGNKHMS